MDKKSNPNTKWRWAKKNLIIRLIVYPTLIVIIFLSGRAFFWKEYAKHNPEQALEMHKVWMKIQGIEYCETPQEAVQRYAEALIKGDRDEALKYVAKSIYSESWERHKKGLYNESDEEILATGKGMKKGKLAEEWQHGWSGSAEYIYILNNQSYNGIVVLEYGIEGWKIH